MFLGVTERNQKGGTCGGTGFVDLANGQGTKPHVREKVSKEEGCVDVVWMQCTGPSPSVLGRNDIPKPHFARIQSILVV